MTKEIGVWFPAIRTGAGVDVFTARLALALEKHGVRTQITWLPHRAEILPWTVSIPKPPIWANVVHINSWLDSRFIPAHLPVLVTLHSCIHDPALNQYKSPLQKLYHQRWVWQREKESIDRANIVTAVSKYTAIQAEQTFFCAGIIPVHNWIDPQKFFPSENRSPHAPFQLLFVGNARRKLKGADLLASIMRSLGSEYELRFTGSREDLGEVKSLPSNMIAIGRLKTEQEVVDAYQSADALLFPTRLEGFGLVALEAQACGLPVITTAGSSLPEVVDDGVSGFLCPKDDVSAFVDAIRHLKDCPDEWGAMRLAARRRAQNLFSEDQAIEKYLSIYRSL